MNIRNLHLIKNSRGTFAYYYPTYNIISIDELSYKILASLKKKVRIEDIAYQYHMTIDEVKFLISPIFNIQDTIDKQQLKNEDTNRRYIKRITLHVSNDCNLRCKYCYASGGNYTQKRIMMSTNTALSFVDFCVENFDKIENIVFFGGEPMLNIPVMELICAKFKELHTEDKLKHLPNFAIITNGTIFNQKILSFLKNNISIITVSIDGPKEINDYNRIHINGKGTFNEISKFIRTIKNETNIKINFESTYTKEHLLRGYNHRNIISYLKKEFDITGFVEDEKQTETLKMKQNINLVNFDNLVNEKFTSIPIPFKNILLTLIRKQATPICNITKTIFSVSANGDIYPCHMCVGEQQNCLGNINSDNIFNNLNYRNKAQSVFTLKNNKQCEKCWANQFCGGCALYIFYNDKTKTFSKYPQKDICEYYKKQIEDILTMIVEIRKNPMLWNMLVKEMVKNKK